MSTFPDLDEFSTVSTEINWKIKHANDENDAAIRRNRKNNIRTSGDIPANMRVFEAPK